MSAGPDTPAKCFRGLMLLNWLTNAHYSAHPEMSSWSTLGPMSDRERVMSDDSAYSLDARQVAPGLRPGESRLLAVVHAGSGCCRCKLCVGDYRYRPDALCLCVFCVCLCVSLSLYVFECVHARASGGD